MIPPYSLAQRERLNINNLSHLNEDIINTKAHYKSIFESADIVINKYNKEGLDINEVINLSSIDNRKLFNLIFDILRSRYGNTNNGYLLAGYFKNVLSIDEDTLVKSTTVNNIDMSDKNIVKPLIQIEEDVDQLNINSSIDIESSNLDIEYSLIDTSYYLKYFTELIEK